MHHGQIVRLGARVDKEANLQWLGHGGLQALREMRNILVQVTRVRVERRYLPTAEVPQWKSVDHSGGARANGRSGTDLCRHSGSNLGVGMTHVADIVARVEVARATLIEEVLALAAYDEQRVGVLVRDGLSLGEVLLPQFVNFRLGRVRIRCGVGDATSCSPAPCGAHMGANLR
eukprot:SAG11_NODE_4448_length_1891_cov_2.406250_2_plen_174_part_00